MSKVKLEMPELLLLLLLPSPLGEHELLSTRKRMPSKRIPARKRVLRLLMLLLRFWIIGIDSVVELSPCFYSIRMKSS